MKRCTKCGEVKPLSDFYKDSRNPDGLRSDCRACVCERQHQRYIKDPQYRARMAERKRERYINDPEHRERVRERLRKWYVNNPKQRERVRERGRQQRANDPNYEAERWRKRYDDPEHRARELARNRKRRAGPEGALTSKLRNAIGHCIRKGQPGGQRGALRHLPYTIAELKAHLESQFQPGMSWENSGTAWHIDHDIPLKRFGYPLPGTPEFLQAWALSNLQPMWEQTNIAKGAMTTQEYVFS